MATEIVSVSADRLVTREELKKAANIDSNDDNALIDALYESALSESETETGRTLLSRTFREHFESFPACSEIELWKTPVGSVTSVNYYDDDNVLQTLSPGSYIVDTVSRLGRIVLVSGASWPSTAIRPNAVVVEYVAGYEPINSENVNRRIPERARNLIRMRVVQRYEDREGAGTDKYQAAIDALVAQLRVVRFH